MKKGNNVAMAFARMGSGGSGSPGGPGTFGNLLLPWTFNGNFERANRILNKFTL